jgi:hypothetical protein
MSPYTLSISFSLLIPLPYDQTFLYRVHYLALFRMILPFLYSSSTEICNLINSFFSHIHFSSIYSPFYDMVKLDDDSTTTVISLSSSSSSYSSSKFRFPIDDGLIFSILLLLCIKCIFLL